MIYLDVILKMKPVPKSRPRFSGHAYTPTKTRNAEALIRKSLKSLEPDELLSIPLSLEVTFYHKTPKSWSKKKTNELIHQPKTSKPDADNLLKLVKDSLQGFMKDDSFVTTETAKKRWSDEDKIHIVLKEDLIDVH